MVQITSFERYGTSYKMSANWFLFTEKKKTNVHCEKGKHVNAGVLMQICWHAMVPKEHRFWVLMTSNLTVSILLIWCVLGDPSAMLKKGNIWLELFNISLSKWAYHTILTVSSGLSKQKRWALSHYYCFHVLFYDYMVTNILC